MDFDFVSAAIGLVGGLIGVALGALLQQRSNHAQLCRETTLELYDRFDDPDILESRIRADRILCTNSDAAQPQCFSELYASLPRDETWKRRMPRRRGAVRSSGG